MSVNSLPPDIVARLLAVGVETTDEVGLRQLLEANVTAYTLYRLPPAAARKWKARYRIMLGATYLDCQTAAEAYAQAYLHTRQTQLAEKPRPDISSAPATAAPGAPDPHTA